MVKSKPEPELEGVGEGPWIEEPTLPDLSVHLESDRSLLGLAERLPEDQFQRLLERLRGYAVEIDQVVDPRIRADLFFDVGRIYETRVQDARQALIQYQRAFRCDPSHLGSVRAARRVFARSGRWKVALHLFDVEIRAGVDDGQRVQLLIEQADVHRDGLRDPEGAARCLAAALELEPGNERALRDLAELAGSGNETQVIDVAEAVEACAEPELRAGLLIDAAAARLRVRPDDAEAVELLHLALEAVPGHADAVGVLSRRHRRLGAWRDLLELLDAQPVPGAVPRRQAEHFVGLAHIARDELSDLPRAIGYVTAALELDPEDHGVAQLLSELLEQAGRAAEAVPHLERLIDRVRDPGDRVELLARLAEIHLEAEAKDAAVHALERLLEIEPTWLPALRALGGLLKERQDWRGLVAMHEAELAYTEHPEERAWRCLRLGELRESRLGDREGAVSAFRHALRDRPGWELASRALGRVLAALGDWEGQAALLESQLEYAGADARVALLERLARCYERLESPPRAIAAWRQMLDGEGPGARSQAIRAIARLAAQTRDWEMLLEMNELEVSSLPAADPRVVDILLRSAEICDEKMGDEGGACALLEQALLAAPGCVSALRHLGRLHQSAGRWHALIETFLSEAETTEVEADALKLRFKIGEVWRDNLDDPEAALHAFEDVLARRPDYLPALRAVRALCRLRGDLAREAEYLAVEAELVQDPPTAARLLCRLGECYRHALGQPELAAEAYEKALRAAPDDRRILRALVALAEERGDLQEAVTAWKRYTEMLDRPEEKAAAQMEIGRLCEGALDVEAVEAFETVLEHAPGHRGALLSLARIYRRGESWAELAAVYEWMAEVSEAPDEKATLLLDQARLLECVLDDVEGALQAAQIAVDLVPKRVEALECLENLAWRAGRRELVAELLERRLARTDEPRLRRALLLELGHLLADLGQAEAAITFYEEARALRADAAVLSALRALLEGAGREQEGLELLEAEAGVMAPKGGCELLLEAARRREARGEHEQALENYREALRRSPASGEAETAIRNLCERGDRWELLVEVLCELAGLRGERRVEIMAEVSQIVGTRLRDRDRELEILSLVAELPDATVEVLRRLGDLHSEAEHWDDAALAYTRARLLSGDPELCWALSCRLVAIHVDKRSDLERARGSLDWVIGRDPDHVEALLRRAALSENLGDWTAALEDLRRALRRVDDPARRESVQQRVAWAAQQVGRLDIAGAALEALWRGDRSNVECLRELGAVLIALGQGETVRAHALQSIEALGDAPRRADLVRRWFAELGLGDLEDRAATLVALEALAGEEPGDRSVLLELAGAAERGSAPEKALEAYLALLREAPFEVDALRRVCGLSEQLGHHDRALLVGLLLVALNAADAEIEPIVQRWRVHQARWPSRPIDRRDRKLLTSEGEPPGLAALLGDLQPHIAKLLSAPEGLTSAPGEVMEDIARVGRHLGVRSARAYVDPNLVGPVGFTDGKPPTAIFAPGVAAAMGQGERQFHLTRALELCRRRLGNLVGAPLDEVRGALEVLAGLDGEPVPLLHLDEAICEARRVRFLKGLRAASRRIIEARGPALRCFLEAAMLDQARAAFRGSAGRVAFMICGGIAPALVGLGRIHGGEPRQRDAESRIAWLRGSHDARELVSWMVSDACYQARRRLGQAVGADRRPHG